MGDLPPFLEKGPQESKSSPTNPCGHVTSCVPGLSEKLKQLESAIITAPTTEDVKNYRSEINNILRTISSRHFDPSSEQLNDWAQLAAENAWNTHELFQYISDQLLFNSA